MKTDQSTEIVDVAYASWTATLYVATNKEVTAYDIKTGARTRLYVGLVSEHDDILAFALSSSHTCFIIADTGGVTRRVNLLDGAILRSSKQSEQTRRLIVDTSNHLVLSLSPHVCGFMIVSCRLPSCAKMQM